MTQSLSRVVPVEPTDAMLDAAFDAFEIIHPMQYGTGTEARKAIWAAMLSAAPAPDPDTLSEAVGLLRNLLANLDGLDDYMKQPERGGYGVECAVCMNEWLEPDDRADMEAARAFLDANTPDPTKGTT